MTTTTKTAKSYKEAMELVEQFHASRPDCYFAYDTENYSDDYKTTKRFFTGFGNDGSAIPFAMIEFVVAGKLDSVRVLDTCRGIAVDIKIEIPEAAIEETAEKITVESARAQGWSLEEFSAANAGLSLAEYREKKAAEEAAFAARELHNKIVDIEVEIGHVDAEIDYLSGLINDLAKNHFSELADNLNKLAALNAQLASLESKNVETDTEAPEATVEVKAAKFEEGKTYFTNGAVTATTITVIKRTAKMIQVESDDTIYVSNKRYKINESKHGEFIKLGFYADAPNVFAANEYNDAAKAIDKQNRKIFGEFVTKVQESYDAAWREEIESTPLTTADAIDATIDAEQALADVNTDKNLKETIIMTTTKIANTDNVKQQDDFTAELAKLKAAADEAEITFIKAREAREQTKNALVNFLNDTTFKLKEKLDALPLDYTITLKKTGGTTYHVVDFSEIYIGAYHIGCDIEFRFENWKFRVIARYDTPAQVETVINQLKAAIVRGDNEFTFPTIEELNSPIANTDDDTEDAVDVFSLLPTLDELNDVELSEPQDVEAASPQDTIGSVADTCQALNSAAPQGWQIFYDTTSKTFPVEFNGKQVAALDSLATQKILSPDRFFEQFKPLTDVNYSPRQQFLDSLYLELDHLEQLRRDVADDSERLLVVGNMIDNIKRDIVSEEMST